MTSDRKLLIKTFFSAMYDDINILYDDIRHRGIDAKVAALSVRLAYLEQFDYDVQQLEEIRASGNNFFAISKDREKEVWSQFDIISDKFADNFIRIYE